MAGTNAIAVKTALLGLFKTAIAPVRIDDSYFGRLEEREYVYFGHIVGEQEPMVYRAGSRQPRQEMLTVPLHLEVVKPNALTSDTDARAGIIGAAIEEALAADPTLAALAVPGLLAAWVSNFTLTSFYPSDGVAATELVYTITVQSKLG